jgi:hypothetical protein
MDDEERLEGEEEMELDEASDGEDDDEENSGIPISPVNSDQLLSSTATPNTSQCLSFHVESLNSNARDAYSSKIFFLLISNLLFCNLKKIIILYS